MDENETSQDIILQQLTETEMHLALVDEEPADLSQAVKLPLSAIPMLGTALASLPSSARTVTTTLSGPKLLYATDKLGNILDPSVLHTTEGGMLGSYGKGRGAIRQARFHELDPSSIKAVAQVPYDPTALMVAAMLAQINQKLDAIQASVDELYTYVRQKDKSETCGNLKTLSDILTDYGVNQGNALYVTNAHMKVLDIKQSAQQHMDQYKKLAEASLGKKSPFEIRATVDQRLNKMLDDLKEYQLSLYVYSFAMFLEPVLAENYAQDKLELIEKHIKDEALRYRLFYTRCYDAIEASAAKALDTAVLGGIASVSSKLSKAIEQTSVGDHTLIDKGLGTLGEKVAKLNGSVSTGLVAKLQAARIPDMQPFIDSIETMNLLHNKPTQVAIDENSVYVLPVGTSA